MSRGLDAGREALASRMQALNPGYDSLAIGTVKSYDASTDTLIALVDRGGENGADEWGPMPILHGMAATVAGEVKGVPQGIGCVIGIISQQQHVSETAGGHICLGFFYNAVVPPPQMPAPTSGPANPGEDYRAGAQGQFVFMSEDGATAGDKQGGLRLFGAAFAALWGTVKTYLGAATGIDDTNDAVVTVRYLNAALHAENAGLKTWANANFQAGANSAPAPTDPATQGSSKVKAAQ